MNDIILQSVEDYFRWRLSEKILDKYCLEKVHYKSVENSNRELANLLGWPNEIDVLYSFLLIYKLGLRIVNEDKFNDIKISTQKYLKVEKLNTNCPEFLFRCSRDEEYKELNTHMEDFLKIYFSIGNVIPIWPGGNEARGKMGVYDIPEIFFNQYPIWTKTLVENYKNVYLDSVINNDIFCVCRKKESNGYNLKMYKDVFINIKEFYNMLKNDEQIFYDYLDRRNRIIRTREEKLLEILKKK